MNNRTILQFAQFISAVGAGLNLSGFTIFFITVRGFEETAFGLGLAIAGVIGFLLTVPFSGLADAKPVRSVYIALTCISGVTVVGLSFVHHWWLFVLLAGLQSSFRQSMNALLLVFVGALFSDKERTVTMARLRVVRNIGFSIGALLASVILIAPSDSIKQLLVALPGIALLLTVPLLVKLPDTETTTDIKVGAASMFASWGVVRDWTYTFFAIANTPLMLFNALLTFAIPVLVSRSDVVPDWSVSFFLILNTAMVIVLQQRFARYAENNRGALWSVLGGAAFLVISFLVFGVYRQLQEPEFLFSMVLLTVLVVSFTIAEILNSAGMWQLTYSLADERTRSAQVGLHGSITSLHEVLATPLIGLLLVADTFLPFLLMVFLIALSACALRVFVIRRSAAGV